jgi:hypothetical protein
MRMSATIVTVAYDINVFGANVIWLDFKTAQRAAATVKGTEDESMHDCPVAITSYALVIALRQ